MLRTCTILAACLLAGTTALQAQSNGGRDDGDDVAQPSFEAEENSVFCGLTFFTNGDDQLDFRGSESRRCFDMKGGDDLLILNRSAFPAGIELSTGTGRDTVWATDGHDRIVDPDGQDAEIRTYGGDDTIEIGAAVARVPQREIPITQPTEISPGTGSNLILMGYDLDSNAHVREGFNVTLAPADGALDRVEAICGRPWDRGIYDLRTRELPETARLSVESFGCGMGLFGIHGDLELRQTGGRLAIQTATQGFRVARGENIPTLSVEVASGSDLLLDLEKASPDSRLSWEGFGNVAIRNRMEEAGYGGGFAVRAGSDIFFEGRLTEARAAFALASETRIDLTMTARSEQTPQTFTLAAPRMDIRWRYVRGAAFPLVSNTEPVRYETTIYDINAAGEDRQGEDAAAADPEARENPRTERIREMRDRIVQDPDVVVNEWVELGRPDLRGDSRSVSITPGTTRLSLVFRRDGDRRAPCVTAQLVDRDGLLPDQSVACVDRNGPQVRLDAGNASAYEEIRVWGRDVDMRIEINGASGFSVDRLEIGV